MRLKIEIDRQAFRPPYGGPINIVRYAARVIDQDNAGAEVARTRFDYDDRKTALAAGQELIDTIKSRS